MTQELKECAYCGELVERPCQTAGEMVWMCDNVVFGEPLVDGEVAREGER